MFFLEISLLGGFLDLGGNENNICITCINTICIFILFIFGSWMFKGAHDVFALIVKILEANWQLQHIIEFFEISKIVNQRFAKNLEIFFEEIWINNENNFICQKWKKKLLWVFQ